MNHIIPIPKELLIHNITYCERINDDRYGGRFKEPITISNVLVQPSDEIVKTGPNEEKLLKGTLFIDCINSQPAFELIPQSKITFEDKEMIIQNVKPIYAFKLHHYEVGLV